MARTLEHISDTIFRLGLAAESAFNAKKPFRISLACSSYSSALALRKDFYSSRHFLRTLKQRKPQDAMPFLSALSGLERISVSRVDKAPAEHQLATLGSVYVDFYAKTDIDGFSQQLDALGIPSLDIGYNPATTTDRDLMLAASTSPQDLYTPTHQPSREIPLTERSSLPDSITIFDQTFTTQDVFAPSAHENLHKLSLALLEPSTPISQTKVKLFRRKLLESSNISPSLRDFLLSDLFPS